MKKKNSGSVQSNRTLPSLFAFPQDAPSGSKGAKEAGMTVIAVPDPALPRALYEPHAHEILSSLSEFDPKKYGLSLEL